MAPESWAVREDVLAILAVRSFSTRAERVLTAVAAGKQRPTRLVVAVAAQEDPAVRAAVESTCGSVSTATVFVGQCPNLATVVARALREVTVVEPWVWILHEDSAPTYDCLSELTAVGERSTKLGAVGPKQVGWDDPERLVEVGIRATRSGRRVPEIDVGERDQGQYDIRSDVLGIGTAGMLVRLAAAEEVGWLDTALGPFGDGLEFSRRLRAAGWRVAISPGASIQHERVSFAKGKQSYGKRRAAQLYNSLVAARALWLPFAVFGYVLGGPIRALARLLTKEPGLAAQELSAVGAMIGMLPKALAARARLRRVRKVPASVVAGLEASGRDVRVGRRARRWARIEAETLANRPDPIVLQERRAWRASTRKWGVFAAAAAAAAGLLATIDILGSELTGGGLLRDSWTFGDLAHSAAHAWLPSGDGLAAPVDALWILLAPFVGLTGSTLGSFAGAIVVCGVALSALTGFLGFRVLTNSPQVRALGALGWAFAPPLLAAVSSGHTAAVVWHALAPLALRAAVAAWRTGSVPALGSAAILAAYMSAAAPATLAPAVLLAVVGFFTRSKGRWHWLWLPVPALAALAPTLRAALNSDAPWRLFASTPGQPVSAAPSKAGLLSFSPTSTVGAPGTLLEAVSLVAPGILLALAMLALVRKRNSSSIRAGLALLGTGWAWAAACLAVRTGSIVDGNGYLSVRGWAGIGLSLAFLGLLVSLVSAGDGLRTDLKERSFSFVQIGLSAATAAACAATLAFVGAWGLATLKRTPNDVAKLALSEVKSSAAPAIAVSDQKGPKRNRVLALSTVEGGIQAHLWRGNGAELHETSMVASLMSKGDAADLSLTRAIASLAGDSEGFTRTVAEHAVSVVLVKRDDSPANRALVSELNSVEGLEYVTTAEAGSFWRVRQEGHATSRLTAGKGEKWRDLPSGGVSADARIPSSDGGGRVALAERADSGWRASLDGKKLEPVKDGWRQAWRLPSGGGRLEVDFDTGRGLFVAACQAIVAVAAAVTALPLKKRRAGE